MLCIGFVNHPSYVYFFVPYGYIFVLMSHFIIEEKHTPGFIVVIIVLNIIILFCRNLRGNSYNLSGITTQSGITVVIDGNESWISPIVVDGITYKVKKNLIPDTIDEYIGQDVVFTVENGEIVWFSTVWDLVQKINCNLVVTDEITYSGKKYSL